MFSHYYGRSTPSDAIELNINELDRTKLAFNRPMYTKRSSAMIKNAPPSVIVQNYLGSNDTSRHFDWLYI